MTRFLNPLVRAARKLFSPRPTVRRPAAPRLGVESLEVRAMPAMMFSLNQFEQNIRNNFENNSIGYAYSINSGGDVAVRADGGGLARTDAETDGAVAFTENTRMTSASIAKQLTAVAIAKIIQDSNGAISFDSPIGPYLPSSWTRGPNINAITFRELMTHHAGIRAFDIADDGQNSTGTDWNNDGVGDGNATLKDQTWYNGLRAIVQYGIPTNGVPGVANSSLAARKANYNYENANFALLRVMVAYMRGNGAAADDASNKAKFTADAYVSYVKNNVLAPMGILNADTKPSGSTSAYNYVFPADGAAGAQYQDRTLYAGGEGWWMSVDEWATFLDNIRYGTNVISNSTRNQMRSGFLGWNNPADANFLSFGSGTWGTYYSHGGDLFGSNHDLNTGIMDFPNGVQVALFVNSGWGAGAVPHGNAYQLELLKRAWENAWTDIELSGTNSDDTFVVQRNSNDSQAIDIFRNGTRLATRWIESLDSLTLNGLGGNDTFTIRDLPASITLTINGGANDDTINLTNNGSAANVLGTVVANGGSGTDSLKYNDSITTNLGENYTFTASTITRSDKPGAIYYTGFEDVAVRAGTQDDTFYVNSTAAGAGYRLYGGEGDDTFYVGQGNLGTNIKGRVYISGQDDNDAVLFSDYNSAGVNEQYVLEADELLKAGFAGATFDTLENVTLTANAQANIIDVLDVLPSTDLTVYALNGYDTVRVHRTGAGSVVDVHGHEGGDTFELATSNGALTQIDGTVNFYGGTGADELVLHDEYGSGVGNYTFGTSVFDAAGLGLVNFTSTERLELQANGDDNVIRVNALLGGSDLTVHGNDGNDQIYVGGATATLAPIQGELRVYGGTGADGVRFVDTASGSNTEYQILSDGLIRNGSTVARFSSTDVVLLSGIYDDKVDVLDVLSGVQVDVFTGGGDDIIRAHRVASGGELRGFGGADIDMMELTPTSHALTNLDGLVSFDGGDGNDKLRIDDEDGTGVGNYTFSELFGVGIFDATGVGMVGYEAERVELIGNGDANTIRVNGLPAETKLTARGRGGDDTFDIGGAAADLDGIKGTLELIGGADADTLRFRDTNDTGDDTYLVNGDTFDKSGLPQWHFEQMSTMIVDANGGDNYIVIPSQGVIAMDLVVNAGGGDDTINVGGLNLGTIYGGVMVNGGAGADTIHLRDELAPAARTYTLGGSSIDVNSFLFGDLGYSSMANVVLHAGGYNDTVTLTSSLVSTALSVYANGGDDTINVGTGDVYALAGGVLVNGGNGADAVTVDDSTDTGNEPYSITGTTVAKFGFQLTYENVSALTLIANTGSNVIDVHDTLATTSLTVDGGTGVGSDTLRLAPFTQNLSFVAGPVSFIGRDGFDRVWLRDDQNGVARQYSLSPGSVSRGGFGGLTYDAATEVIRLDMGDRDDTAQVVGLAPTTAIDLYGNGGGDIVDVLIRPAGPNSGGTLSFDGGPNEQGTPDQLRVHYAPAPVVDHQPSGDGSGLVTLDYPEALYLIGYENVEQFDLLPM